LVKRRMSS
jgi:hypothetical protein